MRQLRVLLLTLALASPAWATITFVAPSPSGNDGNPCGAPSNFPREHIAAGVACLGPGDTLFLRGGTYNEEFSPAGFRIPSGNGEGSRITISGAPGETVYIPGQLSIQDNFDGSSPQYLTLNNLLSEHVNIAAGSHHITVSNSEFTGGNLPVVNITKTTDSVKLLHNKIHGARFDTGYTPDNTPGQYGCYCNGHNMELDGNEFWDNYGYALHFYLYQGAVDSAIVRNNIFHENGFNDGTRNLELGVIVIYGGNNLVYNNIFYNNHPTSNGPTIAITAGTGGFGPTNNRIYNNTFAGNGGTPVVIGADSANTDAANNIFWQNGGDSSGIENYASGTLLRNNLTTDPQFVGSGSAPYRPQAAAALDHGICLAAVPVDIETVARPQPAGGNCDIGAYEGAGAGGPPPTAGPQAVQWKFDEGTGATTADATNNGYTGTLVNGPTWGPGRVGTGALTFNGASQYVTTSAMTWLPGQPVTVLLWRKVTACTANGTFGMETPGTTQRFGAHIPYSNCILYFDYGDRNTTGRIFTDYTPYVGRWTRVALVSAGTSGAFKAIYLNGVLATSQPSSDAPTQTMTSFDVGRWLLDTGALDDTGSIDDFRLDNRVWSAAEILTDYRQTSTVRRHRIQLR